MRNLSPTAAGLIASVLALLLLAYVFIGPGGGKADAKPRCSSKQSLELIEAELFKRAAAIRGLNDEGFLKTAGYSSIRALPRMTRRLHDGSQEVTCAGSIALDLPPGVAVVGGRHNLASRVTYRLRPGLAGKVELMMLGDADEIVVPLATLAEREQQVQPPALPEAASRPETAPANQVAPEGREEGRPPAVIPRKRVSTSPSEPRTPAQRTADPAPSEKRAAAPAPAKPAVAQEVARQGPAAAVPVARVRPSFNCRNARTRGEIAVCRNADLASLDRQMATQFYRSRAAARPGQRVMLDRTRTRFLRYRDSCGSAACVADAYRGRMKEIDDIMSGSW